MRNGLPAPPHGSDVPRVDTDGRVKWLNQGWRTAQYPRLEYLDTAGWVYKQVTLIHHGPFQASFAFTKHSQLLCFSVPVLMLEGHNQLFSTLKIRKPFFSAKDFVYFLLNIPTLRTEVEEMIYTKRTFLSSFTHVVPNSYDFCGTQKDLKSWPLFSYKESEWELGLSSFKMTKSHKSIINT